MFNRARKEAAQEAEAMKPVLAERQRQEHERTQRIAEYEEQRKKNAEKAQQLIEQLWAGLQLQISELEQNGVQVTTSKTISKMQIDGVNHVTKALGFGRTETTGPSSFDSDSYSGPTTTYYDIDILHLNLKKTPKLNLSFSFMPMNQENTGFFLAKFYDLGKNNHQSSYNQKPFPVKMDEKPKTLEDCIRLFEDVVVELIKIYRLY